MRGIDLTRDRRPRVVPDKDFELALSELIDSYRKCIPHSRALDAIHAQWIRVADDDSWRDPASDDYKPGDIVDLEPPGAA